MMSLNKLPGAEVAMQGGLYASPDQIRADWARRQGRLPARSGSAAYISRGHAVISMRKLQSDGLFGWVGWLFIHIAFLTGYRNRFGAILTWFLAFTRETRRERAFTSAVIDTSSDIYLPAAGRPAGEKAE
jgi:NADH dehydrogenase